MPLTAKGRKILRSMQKEYGAEKGREVFYASIRKGIIKGAELRVGASHKRRSAGKSMRQEPPVPL